jgi:hypothetical protein
MDAGLVLGIADQKLDFVVLLRYSVIRLDGNGPERLPVGCHPVSKDKVIERVKQCDRQY